MKGPTIRKYLGFLVMTLALVLAAGQVKAAYIDDRDVLDALLVGASHEDFESYSIPSGHTFEPSPLVSSTGAQFLVGADAAANAMIQINDQGYLGQPSKDIASYNSKTIVIDFTNVYGPESEQVVIAFGLDMLAFEAYFGQDFSDHATVVVYGTDGLVLFGEDDDPNNIYLSALEPVASVFFGFHDESGNGIGRVEITGDNGYQLSPIIDNISFGSQVVPIPSAVWLLGSGLLGLLGLRRKFR